MSDIIPDSYNSSNLQRDTSYTTNASENIEPTLQELPRASGGHKAKQPSSEVVAISSLMSASDIAIHLGEHGCKNITDRLDTTSCSTYPLSSGGFGDVYRGKLDDATPVAIKTMRLQMNPTENGQKPLKHAARELHTWSKCRHPNVVELLGLVEFRGQIGMVSHWMDNGNLLSYLAQRHDVDRCWMSVQISEGLAYLHRSNIIHGDLKGLNVLISNKGVPVLADFGNAVLQERTLQFTYTTVKANLSPRWAAPEIIEGSGTYSFAADVYALGMTILETFTGQVPYLGKNDHAVYYAVAVRREHPGRPEDQIPADSQHGNVLWSTLTRCWVYEAEARPRADDVVEIMKTITREGLMPTSAAEQLVAVQSETRMVKPREQEPSEQIRPGIPFEDAEAPALRNEGGSAGVTFTPNTDDEQIKLQLAQMGIVANANAGGEDSKDGDVVRKHTRLERLLKWALDL